MTQGIKETHLLTGLIGVLAGIGLTIGGLNMNYSPTKRVRVIEKENMPKIMKVYNRAIANQILIENPESVGQYISLSDYLEKNLNNKYERNLERARIELLVSQAEEKNKK